MLNRHTFIGILIAALVASGVYAYYQYTQYYPSTDDAYVGANLVNVAPKVNGYLTTLNVKNNQEVQAGELLFTLNPRDYDLSFSQAQKNYLSYSAQIDMTRQQYAVQLATLKRDTMQYTLAAEIAKRYLSLYKAHTLAKQTYDDAATNLAKLQVQLNIDQKKVTQMQNAIDFMQAKQDAAKAAADLAHANVGYTMYASPVNGYITNLTTLTPGEFINAGEQIFGIVEDGNWWIDANFKETQIERIKPGQQVTIKLDMYPHTYHGIVDSISYASGSTFSLLPAQNATGNWVKVTQRFTVRIMLKDDLDFPLRVGASADVTINTAGCQQPFMLKFLPHSYATSECNKQPQFPASRIEQFESQSPAETRVSGSNSLKSLHPSNLHQIKTIVSESNSHAKNTH